jgi:hypothetical protein
MKAMLEERLTVEGNELLATEIKERKTLKRKFDILEQNYDTMHESFQQRLLKELWRDARRASAASKTTVPEKAAANIESLDEWIHQVVIGTNTSNAHDLKLILALYWPQATYGVDWARLTSFEDAKRFVVDQCKEVYLPKKRRVDDDAGNV